LKESDVVQVIGELGRIVIQKQGTATIANDPTRKSIDELFEGYDGDYEPIEIDWGKPEGNEIW
jgi:antitoxin MazE